jgi:cellulose synthase (UDP-forming)
VKARQAILSNGLLVLAGLFALLAITVPLDLEAQWIFAGITIVGATILGRLRSRRALLVLAILSMIVSTRYMFWRTTETLEFGTLAEFLRACIWRKSMPG